MRARVHMTSTSLSKEPFMKPGPSLEKVLYVGCLAAMGIIGVAVAIYVADLVRMARSA